MKNSIIIIAFLSCTLCFAQGPDKEEAFRRATQNMVARAAELCSNHQFQQAEKILSSALSRDPHDDGANYYLGSCYAMRGEYSKSEACFKEAVKADSLNFWYRYRLARLYAMTDRRPLTISMYEDLLRDFPRKGDLYYELVELYRAENQMDKALETLTSIETEFGKNDATAMARFDLLSRMDKRQEAYEFLESYNKEYSSPQVLTALADYQMSMYNDSTALAYYDEALDLIPGFAPALIGKAETFRMTRRSQDYFNTMKPFLADDSVSPEGKSDYLKAIVRQADPKWVRNFRPQLDTLMDIFVQAHPNDSSALLTSGIYYYSTERPDKAKQAFSRNMENWPGSIGAAANYVELLMYNHDWEELSSLGRQCYRTFPNETSFLEMASVADYNLKDYEKVLGICDTILAKAAGDSAKVLSAYTTMGDMYHNLGEQKKAYKAYDKVLKVSPEYLPVLNNYAYYLSLEGRKLGKAYKMSKITVEKEPDNSTYLDTFGWILHLQGKDADAKPFFKHAMLYGGKESVVVLDHYAEVLYALGEYDLAFVYWTTAQQRNTGGEIPDLDEKIARRKEKVEK